MLTRLWWARMLPDHLPYLLMYIWHVQAAGDPDEEHDGGLCLVSLLAACALGPMQPEPY